jgi:hypothetical protein
MSTESLNARLRGHDEFTYFQHIPKYFVKKIWDTTLEKTIFLKGTEISSPLSSIRQT